MKNNSTFVPFPLRTLKSAKVSEISETTAAAAIAETEKINFHIGNPLQDKQLTDFYFKLCSGVDSSALSQLKKDATTTSQYQKLDFLHQTIKNAVAYLPRGGFNSQNPPALIKHIKEWITNTQHEPHSYMFSPNNKREVILVNGGVHEFLRVLFTLLGRYSKQLPIHVCTLGFNLKPHLRKIPSVLPVADFPQDFEFIKIEETLAQYQGSPIVMLIGQPLKEAQRRLFRKLSRQYNILFCELFDAPNHFSLSREAGLKEYVVRFLSAAAMVPDCNKNATQIVMGNAQLLQLIESVHFELKGTPSATELDLFNACLQTPHLFKSMPISEPKKELENEPLEAASILKSSAQRINRIEERLQNVLAKKATITEKIAGKLISKEEKQIIDPWPLRSYEQLLPNVNQSSTELSKAFLAHFTKHHPQYKSENCFTVSGSSRTALSLLGRHTQIDKIITFDWSWSYENGFDHVHTVPLFDSGMLNSKGLLKSVEQQISKDSNWRKTAAVMINNPHNATGEVLEKGALSRLIITLLEKSIFIIDDLCYQDVAPNKEPVKIETVKELAQQAVKAGYLTSDKLRYIITAHSLSKTDCFAGGRLTVMDVPHPKIHKQYRPLIESIIPNQMALFISYLFYRNSIEQVRKFWLLRNKLFWDRAQAISTASKELPKERNPYQIEIRLPKGAMYPNLIIHNFPKGISIDNISIRLSQRGMGMVPLTAFSKTQIGYEDARKIFRLTLGGKDDAATLKRKTRRLLIELNRVIGDEARDYQLLSTTKISDIAPEQYSKDVHIKWLDIIKKVEQAARNQFHSAAQDLELEQAQIRHFLEGYLPWRIKIISKRFTDYKRLYNKLIQQPTSSRRLINTLMNELKPETLAERKKRFKNRLFDRTVHPTQMYALALDIGFDAAINGLFLGNKIESKELKKLAESLINEFLGKNIAINSEQESDELIYDLKALKNSALLTGKNEDVLLSFWGDWDGSTRPSGQGHRLVSAVLLENVKEMARFIHIITQYSDIEIDGRLISELNKLPAKNERFAKLINNITRLTNQFEKKYKGLMPRQFKVGALKRLAIHMHLAKDPLQRLFQHNSRLEKKMRAMRRQRANSMAYYFNLNQRLSQTLISLLPQIERYLNVPQIAIWVSSFRNIIKRFVLTPRIHQKTITMDDPFTVENTVHNLTEINHLGTLHGVPGIIMALQVSMSSQAAHLIKLNRIVVEKTARFERENAASQLHPLWLVPLFEEEETVADIESYLNQIWEYARQTRPVSQPISERFKQISCEMFVAGSDLSQQVGQVKSLELFKETKVTFYRWLAEKGLSGALRLKLGSGEPMQRQGGYYAAHSGQAILWNSFNLPTLPDIKPAAIKSLQFAQSPLNGIHARTDLLTVQSNAAENIFRFIGFEERANLLSHLTALQRGFKQDLIRVGKMFQESRLSQTDKGLQELKRLNRLSEDPVFLNFLEIYKDNFRQILYGKPEDVVGIHVISYFISRMVPTLRDRPTVRPGKAGSSSAGQAIVERIAQTLPLSHHGSMLRAIGHNRSQSMILGVNQLSTGLFRSLKIISDQTENPKALGLILSQLPVAEILHDIRIYQQSGLKWVKRLEKDFNIANSALQALSEDQEYMQAFIPLLQKELLARQGVNAGAFFKDGAINTELLPYLRPDLAVLLQPDLFNADIKKVISTTQALVDVEWQAEMDMLLGLPNRIEKWRERVWTLIERDVSVQVNSFIDLAKAITVLSEKVPESQSSLDFSQAQTGKQINQLNNLLSGAADDSMRQFLVSVVDFITHLPQNSDGQFPINMVRALHDIEKIVKIDAQLLSEKEQNKLRFYTLQMARLAGENG